MKKSKRVKTDFTFNQNFKNSIEKNIQDNANLDSHQFQASDLALKIRIAYEYRRDISISVYKKIWDNRFIHNFIHDFKSFKDRKKELNLKKLINEKKFYLILEVFQLENKWSEIIGIIKKILSLKFKVWTDKKGNTEIKDLSTILKPRYESPWSILSCLIHKEAYDIINKVSNFLDTDNKEAFDKLINLLLELNKLINNLFAEIEKIINKYRAFTHNGKNLYHRSPGCGWVKHNFEKNGKIDENILYNDEKITISDENGTYRSCHNCHFIWTSDLEQSINR